MQVVDSRIFVDGKVIPCTSGYSAHSKVIVTNKTTDLVARVLAGPPRKLRFSRTVHFSLVGKLLVRNCWVLTLVRA